MTTLSMLSTLAARAARVWWAGLPLLITWATVGWIAQRGGLQLSIIVGGGRPWLSLLIFVTGVLINVAALVIMIHSLSTRLPALQQLRRGGARLRDPWRPPASLLERGSAASTVALALGPFLAVYALWGLVDDQIRDLYVGNQVRYGIDPDAWSVDLRRWQSYLLLAVIAWAVKQVAAVVHRRTSVTPAAVVVVLADAIFVFTSFLALYRAAGQLWSWLQTRQLWTWLVQGERAVLDALPLVRLPFDLTLPEVVTAVTGWLVGVGLPALGQHLLLPLMWLALAGVVFGWHDVIEVSEHGRLGRMEAGLRRVWLPLGRLSHLATTDLREKYLPVWHGFRLVWAGGPRFLGAYLVLATAVGWVAACLDWLTTTLVGPVEVGTVLLLDPVLGLVQAILVTTATAAVYAVGFDRAVGAATAEG